jgi:hypothetical protein
MFKAIYDIANGFISKAIYGAIRVCTNGMAEAWVLSRVICSMMETLGD